MHARMEHMNMHICIGIRVNINIDLNIRWYHAHIHVHTEQHRPETCHAKNNNWHLTTCVDVTIKFVWCEPTHMYTNVDPNLTDNTCNGKHEANTHKYMAIH